MRFLTREVIGLLMATILVFLVLNNSAGFARSVRALGGGLSTVARTLQGR